MYETKFEDGNQDFSQDKKMFEFSNNSDMSTYYDDSIKLVVDKIEEETGEVAIELFVGLKPMTYSFLVDYSSDHKKEKGVKKNVLARIIHSEYKYVLSNNSFD